MGFEPTIQHLSNWRQLMLWTLHLLKSPCFS